jgi:hypothetical protein
LNITRYTQDFLPLKNIFKTRKNVAFEVILDQDINHMPYLVVYQDTFYSGNTALSAEIVVRPFSSQGSSYFFELLSQQKPLYFTLAVKEGEEFIYVMKKYHFEPGDNIRVSVNSGPVPGKYELEFSGTGSAKYCCQHALGVLSSDRIKEPPVFSPEGVYNPENYRLKNLAALLALLENRKMELSDYSYHLFKTDLISSTGRALVSAFKPAMGMALNEKDTHVYGLFWGQSLMGFNAHFEINVPSRIKYASDQYAWFIIERRMFEHSDKNGEINLHLVYHLIKETRNEALRDKLIVVFLINCRPGMKHLYADILVNALSVVKNEECLEKLKMLTGEREV